MTTRPAPQTLADVQPGDSVWVFRQRCAPEQATIDRLTKTQIVASGMKFRRIHGKYGSDRPGKSFDGASEIMVGKDADDAVRRANRTAVLKAACPRWSIIMSNSGYRISQPSITEIRAACDAAEAALRELGEWEDKP